MSRQMLIEQRCGSGSLKLNESTSKQLRPGCLGTLSGPCADYKNVTRNGTFYSRKLWENVFNNDLVKESLEDRVLLGELDHPGDRLETKAANACIVMTGYSFDDNEKVVRGDFDILDTPSGRVLKSLLDYGCKIGVSSRGEGDVETSNGVDTVDEDTYYFVGFDAVALPSVKKAKPTLTESVQHKSLKESLMKEVSTATSVSQLDMIKNVLKSTNLPEVDSLMESIDIKSKELTEGTTSTNDQVLLEDLESANRRIKELEANIESLNEEITTSKSRIQRIIESKQKLFNQMRSERRSNQDLKEDYSKMVFESASLSKNNKLLQEELIKGKKRIEELTAEVRTTRSSNIKINNKVRSLSESLREADQNRVAAEKQVSTLINESSSKDSKIKELEESVKDFKSKLSISSKTNKKLQERCSELLEGYVSLKTQVSGVDSKVLSESIKSGSNIKDVDRLIESVIDQKDRYSSLKITKDPLLSSYDPSNVRISGNMGMGSDKDRESVDFLQQTLGKTL